MSSKCILRLLLMFCVTMCASAQSTDASISGQVVDSSGRVITDADIQILNEATGVQYDNRTNSAGIYTVSILPPGQYRVQVSKIGFKTLIKPGITLNVQSSVALNFTLPVGAASESITVESGSSVINTSDGTVGTLIDRKFVANIPLNGRSLQDLISLTPGVSTQNPQSSTAAAVNGDFSVNGQRTESNYYTVDGVTANITAGDGNGRPGNGTGGALGASTALGTTQTLIPVDGLEEFRVQSSTYSAEFGRSPGGQFSLVTRSGTNNLHGSAFNYLRNNFFDANDWFNDRYQQPTPALRQNDFGGTFGGPVSFPHLYDGRNRTFFFLAYEGLRLTQPTAATIQYVPDNFMRQQAPSALQPILNAYPRPNGNDYGTVLNPSLAQFISAFSLPSSINSGSARIDHTFSPKLSVFFRFGDTPSSTGSRPTFTLLTQSINATTYTFGATSQITNRINNEFRLGYSASNTTEKSSDDGFGGGTPIDLGSAMGAGAFPSPTPLMYIYIAGIGTSEFATQDSSSAGRQWNLVDTVSVTHGQHNFRFGVDYRRIKSLLRQGDPELFVEYLSAKTLLENIPDLPEVIRYVPSTPVFNELALFAQDTWRISSGLSLSYGLRWELNPPPTEEHGNDAYTLSGNIGDPSSLSLAPQGTPLWNTTWLNLAPRIGLAWMPHQQDRWQTVVRAGGGVFFDTLNQVGALGYDGLGFLTYKILSGASLPFSQSQIDFPVTVAPPYTTTAVYAFPSHLQLPYTLQWNTSLQQALGKAQSVTISYVASNGRRLIGEQELNLSKLNPNFGTIDYFPGGVTSNYQSLQLQFQRTIANGVQALGSYTWSHSIDFGSTGTALPLQRADSDFDVRNNFQAALSWDLPSPNSGSVPTALLGHWGLDGRLMARSAFPIPLQGNTFTDPSTGAISYGELDRVSGQPVYLYGSQYPGGKAINPSAFLPPAAGVVGDAPRNFLRGFGATQLNLAARKQFTLAEGIGLQFRAEFFNILNHPNFGLVDSTYGDATFGQATEMLNHSLGTLAAQYQQGGPRSMQFALKLAF